MKWRNLFHYESYDRQIAKLHIFVELRRKRKSRAFLLAGATYNNLGDQAITYAQELFLKDKFGKENVLVVPDGLVDWFFKKYSHLLSDTDTYTFPGGGNMGDLYPTIEHQRQNSIKKLRNLFGTKARIIVFPQSLDFNSEKSVSKAKTVYSGSTVVARERRGKEFAQDVLEIKDSRLTPDIVLYLTGKIATGLVRQKKSVGLIARSDKEQVKSSINVDAQSIAQKLNSEVDSFDTVISESGMYTSRRRKRKIDKILNRISKNDLIITDRLHGMILAFISGVPVVAYDNATHKVRNTIKEWLESSGKVFLVSEDAPFDKDNFFEWYSHLNQEQIPNFDKSIYDVILDSYR